MEAFSYRPPIEGTITRKADPSIHTNKKRHLVLVPNNGIEVSLQAQPIEPVRKLSEVTNEQLQEVNRLQRIWNDQLGLEDSEPGELLNYNPVLARWNFERLQTDEQREQFKKNELINITTALRERHETQESRLELFIDNNGKIRNDAFPDEPYEDMLERGRVYREQNGSKDLEREQSEIDGFKKIQNVLTDPDTPIGSLYMVISPPSKVKDSPYGHNFVDGYQVVEDEETGERRFNYTRFSSPLDDDAYSKIAERFDPKFFERKAQKEKETGQAIPMDAWFLENPFYIPAKEGQDIDTVFNEHFSKDVKAMKEEEWQKMYKMYLPYMLYLIDQLTKPHFDPEGIGRSQNILLLVPERKNLQMDKEIVVFDGKNHTTDSLKLNQAALSYMNRMAHKHGHEQAEEKKVGCGKSSGVSIKNGEEFMKNSVSEFGKKGKQGDEQEWFSCPKCSFRADGPVGNSCPGCGLTKEAFAAETGIICD